MIVHAAGFVAFAAEIPRDLGQIGMCAGPHAGFEQRLAIFRAENDMNDDER